MRVLEARNLFRSLTSLYFQSANVVMSGQSRIAKPDAGLVVITPGAVRRPNRPTADLIDGESVGLYPSRIMFTIDSFTHGSPVIATAEEAELIPGVSEGDVIAYENSALDDLLAFADFLNSDYVIWWSHLHDVAVLIDGDVQDMTGIVVDHNYEYRARMTVMFYFTQETVGPAALLREDSVKYPDVSGEYISDPPVETESPTNGYETDAMRRVREAIIDPYFKPTSTGGGNEELASQETGYFAEVEIKEEKI